MINYGLLQSINAICMPNQLTFDYKLINHQSTTKTHTIWRPLQLTAIPSIFEKNPKSTCNAFWLSKLGSTALLDLRQIVKGGGYFCRPVKFWKLSRVRFVKIFKDQRKKLKDQRKLPKIWINFTWVSHDLSETWQVCFCDQ